MINFTAANNYTDYRNGVTNMNDMIYTMCNSRDSRAWYKHEECWNCEPPVKKCKPTLWQKITATVSIQKASSLSKRNRVYAKD